MTRLYIELDEHQAQRLRELASVVRKSKQDLCREALESFLQGHERPTRGASPKGYAALRKMIGLVKDGPTDMSVVHDIRPGDEP
jgi:hypothetical protein